MEKIKELIENKEITLEDIERYLETLDKSIIDDDYLNELELWYQYP